MSAGEVKEWVRVGQSARGDVTVKFTVQDGALSVGWMVKAYVSSIKAGVKEARKGAYAALDQTKAALREIERES